MQNNLDGIKDYTTQPTLAQLLAGLSETLLEKVIAEERTNFLVRSHIREVSIVLKG